MKIWMILPIISLLSACAVGPKVKPAPAVTQTATANVAVCNATVTRKATDLDKARPGMHLEEQNTIFRKSLAQMKEYVIELEASFIECGGKIK